MLQGKSTLIFFVHVATCTCMDEINNCIMNFFYRSHHFNECHGLESKHPAIKIIVTHFYGN